MEIIVKIKFDHFDSLSHFYSQGGKLQNKSIFEISAKVQVCDFGQNLKLTKTSEF